MFTGSPNEEGEYAAAERAACTAVMFTQLVLRYTEFACVCACLYATRVEGRKKKESCRRRTAVGSERERPEESKAGEGRLDLKRGKLPSRDNLLGGKSRDFLLLYCYSSRMSIGQVVPNFTYTPFASLAY